MKRHVTTRSDLGLWGVAVVFVVLGAGALFTGVSSAIPFALIACGAALTALLINGRNHGGTAS